VTVVVVFRNNNNNNNNWNPPHGLEREIQRVVTHARGLFLIKKKEGSEDLR
jgi:hypothetical protein